ncbi:MAG: RecQ family ATP-dependent DNA helicase [Bellilinea sp.]
MRPKKQKKKHNLASYHYSEQPISPIHKMNSSKRHQIARFIRNNIAPGGRAFISYEIEQAIRKTFGDYPINVKEESYPLRVLWEENGDAHTAALEKMQRMSQCIFDNYQRQEPVDYDNELISIYYSLYYLPRNLHKVQFILLDLFERGMLPETIHTLDIGSAVGTVPIAVADFYNLLKNTCLLFDVDETFGSKRNSFSCLDASTVNLKNLQKLWGNLAVGSECFEIPETHLVRIGFEENWQEQIPAGPFNLIFASNFLNELIDFDIPHRADLVEQLVSHLSEDGLIVLIEPADEINAKNLHALQYELVNHGLHIHLPCLGACSSNGDGGGCSDCWSWRSESLRMPAISRPLIWNDSQQDEEAIKWCYSVLGRKQKAPLLKPLTKLSNLSLGETDLRVQTVSPLIKQRWVKVCGSDGNSGHAVLELDEHQVITAFTPGDVLTLQRVEVSSPAHSGIFAGMKRIRITVKSQSLRGDNTIEVSDVACQRIDRVEEKEEVLGYFLQRLFGFNNFRPGQFEIISRILTGQDTFGIMATSAGKSLCFQFPAMLLPGITMVVAPLKSLVQDQIYNLRRMGFDNITRIDSDAESVEDALNHIMEGYYKLVYITPEQLTNERVVAKLREAGKRYGFSLFAVDEVHCLSQWGHDFRPAYLNLYRHFREIDPLPDKNVPIIGLTATASEYVIEDVLTSLNFDRSTLVRLSFDRPELSFEVVSIEQDENRLEKIIHLLNTQLPKVIRQPIWPGIIFVPYTGDELDQSTEMYQFSAEGLAKALKEHGYNAAFYHSSMSVSDREQVQEDFKNGNIDILVATKGFGMGIDKEDIRFIIHYSMPESLESYYQQSGRAGRSGEHSHCILLYQNHSTEKPKNENYRTDYSRQEYFINEKYPGTPEQIRQAWDYLRNPQSGLRGSPNRDVLYIDPEQTLIRIGWITEEDLERAKVAKCAIDEWEIFKKDWNKLIQKLEQGVTNQ